MFSIRTIQEQGFEKVLLQEESSGTIAAILPACGALLHAFAVQQDGRPVNVIDSYIDGNDYRQHLTAKGFMGSKLSPFACRLKNGRYHFGQQDYTIEKFYLDKHALHGILYDAVFVVEQMDATESGATVEMVYAYKGTDLGYPFAYDCRVRYTLGTGNKLTIATSIVNQSGGLLPIQDGWHPYFKLGDRINDLQFEFQSKDVVVFDEELIPTGQLKQYEDFGSLSLLGDTQFDHCFTLNFAECQPLCVLRDAVQRIQVEIHPKESYPYLQVYTPPHRQSIAIENLSAAPDAFNNGMGLRVLAAGETAVFETAYCIKVL
jgi:aldose 1-epimerase